MSKIYVIKRIRRNDNSTATTLVGTVAELVQKCSYTLETGASYSHEKGNSKINRNPKTFKSLLTNLNNAVNNAAANGYANVEYVEGTLGDNLVPC